MNVQHGTWPADGTSSWQQHGPATASRARAIQKAHRLSQDGLIESATWRGDLSMSRALTKSQFAACHDRAVALRMTFRKSEVRLVHPGMKRTASIS